MMNVLIHTAHVQEGHNNASGLWIVPILDLVWMALCKVVMMLRAELMHCCKAASYATSLREVAKTGRYNEMIDSCLSNVKTVIA